MEKLHIVETREQMRQLIDKLLRTVVVIVVLYQGVIQNVEVFDSEKDADAYFIKDTEGMANPDVAGYGLEDTDYEGSQKIVTQIQRSKYP